jgi:heme iron utilization protein
MAVKKLDPIRETDDHARQLARRLVEQSSHGALGVIDPESGFPVVSRIAVNYERGGRIFFLASDLSFHSIALASDPRASILLGEPGKGDVLAHPRITLIGTVQKAAPDERGSLRTAWLERHPKAAIYIDFADFNFYRLELLRAHLNGGFGKAYILSIEDFL